MPNFEYIALNAEQKKLAGIITASDIEEAKKKIRDIDLSLLEIKLYNEEINVENNYKFQAKNSEGKTIKGTIEAINKASAILKLVQEYNLKVEFLSDINSTQAEFNDSKQEVSEILKNITSKENKESVSQFNKEISEKPNQGIVEKTIEILKILLNKYSEDIKTTEIKEIQNNIEILEKLKFSKNTEKNKEICEKLLKKITDLEIFKDESKQKKSIKEFLENTISQIYIRNGSSFKHIFNLLFQTSANQTRNILFKRIIKKISAEFNNLIEKINLDNPTIKSINQQSKIYFATYFGIYIIFSIIGSKITEKKLPNIFYIYNSKILIFLVISIFFWHICVESNKTFFKTNKKLQKLNTFLSIFLSILFITNF